jgi:phosphoribosylformimino-5-aminoimidazole carboxamide ribotide isomerase
MIVLPAIDLREGRVVRLRQGRADLETVYGNDPALTARRWVDQGAQWLHVVNLDGALSNDGTTEGDLPSLLNVKHLAKIRSSVPDVGIQFGGGLRTLAAIEMALDAGATRAVVGTAAVRDPRLMSQALDRFGADRIAVALDARSGRLMTHGWLQISETEAAEVGIGMRDLGVRHAIYTDTLRDGMLQGVNVEETAKPARSTGLQVIASGGVATLEDVRRLREKESDGVAGVIIGQALYSGALTLREALQAAVG